MSSNEGYTGSNPATTVVPDHSTATFLDPPERTPQQAKTTTSLERNIARLQSQIAEIEAQLVETREKLKVVAVPDEADAEAIVKRHIRLLHQYNEIKDIGQGLMGLIADGRGVRHVDVQAEFGVGSKD